MKKLLLLILLILSYLNCKAFEPDLLTINSPSNFTAESTISQINLNWTDESDNEDSFTIKR